MDTQKRNTLKIDEMINGLVRRKAQLECQLAKANEHLEITLLMAGTKEAAELWEIHFSGREVRTRSSMGKLFWDHFICGKPVRRV